MAKIIQKYLIVVLLILSIFSILALFKPGFFPTHDYIYIARIQQLDVALKSGHFPVRWSPDFRYGEPLFNFYAPLPYYVGSLIHTFGPGFLTTTKVLLGLSLVLSAVSMFFLGKELFGKWGGLVAAAFYLYAPYRSVDVYVRGALSESWAFIFLPLILLFAYKIAKDKLFKNVIFLALSLAGLYYTHNIMTMMFAPFLALWLITLLILSKDKSVIKRYVIAGLLSVGLGASYLFPAYLEKQFVQTDNLIFGYFDFRAHFITLRQLMVPFWGYGASTWGDGDTLTLQVGLVNLGVIALSGIALTVFYKKLTLAQRLVLITILFSFVGGLFFQHNKSTFIWEKIHVMKFIQFPWRFMGISILYSSLAAGFLTQFLKNENHQKIGTAVLVVIVIAVNFNYFKPESFFSDSVDEHYISKENILYRNDKVPKDYLPVWVKSLSSERVEEPRLVEAQGKISDFVKKTTSATFKANLEEPGSVEVPIFYFPGWVTRVNGEVQKFEEPLASGFIKVSLPKGESSVKVQFKETPLRKLSNIASLLSISFLALFYWKRREWKDF